MGMLFNAKGSPPPQHGNASVCLSASFPRLEPSPGTPLSDPLCAGLLADAPHWRALGQCPDEEVSPWLPSLATNLLAALQSCHSNRAWQCLKRFKNLRLDLHHGPKARPQLQRQLADQLLPVVYYSSEAMARSSRVQEGPRVGWCRCRQQPASCGTSAGASRWGG